MSLMRLLFAARAVNDAKKWVGTNEWSRRCPRVYAVLCWRICLFGSFCAKNGNINRHRFFIAMQQTTENRETGRIQIYISSQEIFSSHVCGILYLLCQQYRTRNPTSIVQRLRNCPSGSASRTSSRPRARSSSPPSCACARSARSAP